MEFFSYMILVFSKVYLCPNTKWKSLSYKHKHWRGLALLPVMTVRIIDLKKIHKDRFVTVSSLVTWQNWSLRPHSVYPNTGPIPCSLVFLLYTGILLALSCENLNVYSSFFPLSWTKESMHADVEMLFNLLWLCSDGDVSGRPWKVAFHVLAVAHELVSLRACSPRSLVSDSCFLPTHPETVGHNI